MILKAKDRQNGYMIIGELTIKGELAGLINHPSIKCVICNKNTAEKINKAMDEEHFFRPITINNRIKQDGAFFLNFIR